MHEIGRGEGTVAGEVSVSISPAEWRDRCARISVTADAPVSARLETTRVGPGTTIVLGEQGPVCVRKGAAIAIVLAAEKVARVRWVAWGT
jgi:hypothetical protein